MIIYTLNSLTSLGFTFCVGAEKYDAKARMSCNQKKNRTAPDNLSKIRTEFSSRKKPYQRLTVLVFFSDQLEFKKKNH